MRSLEQNISEGQALAKKHGLKVEKYHETGVTSLEQRINLIEADLKPFNVKLGLEGWVERGRIRRNNGSSIVVAESDRTTRIREHMTRYRCSWKEASIFTTGSVLPEPGSKRDELAESWKRYCPVLTADEIDTLVKRGVPVPEN